MNQQTSIEQQPAPLWCFSPACDYKPPKDTVVHTVKGGLSGLWHRLRPSSENRESPLAAAQKELRSLPQAVRRQIAPEPDWRGAVRALEEALRPWMAKGSLQSPATLVIPPHSGGDAILRTLADQRDWRVISPPASEMILDRDESWMDVLSDHDSPWVLPALEKVYLRHRSGLALVRGLLERLQSDRLPPGLIGCDSWAFAYLRHVMPGLLDDALASEAFDHERLGHWFNALATTGGRHDVIFRQTDDGTCVLPGNGHAAEQETSPFLRHLAAYSRGIPGVAHALWRMALQNLPEEKAAELGEAERCVWVQPWEQVERPIPEAEWPVEQQMMLHHLLLHGGMPTDLLAHTLPLSPDETRNALHALSKSGLIENPGGAWRVAAPAYPAVRRRLEEAGYLTDDF